MKKFVIVFDLIASVKLKKIFDYLVVNESPKMAHCVLDSLEEAILSLEVLPNRFPKIYESSRFSNFEVRNIFCSSFRIIYVVLDSKVRVLDVRHSAMEPLSKEEIIKYL